MARFTVKVHPRPRRYGHHGPFRRRIEDGPGSAPVDGKANDECVRFLAELAEVPRSSIRIVTGATSRMKLVEIVGMEQTSLDRLLAEVETS